MRYSVIHAFAIAILVCFAPPATQAGEDLLRRAGIQGGLVVQLGCDDGRLTNLPRADDAYLSHLLDTDKSDVATARASIQAEGKYGQCSAEAYDGENLPYVDNLVNAIVVVESSRVSTDEIARVLAPRGKVLLKSDSPLLDNLALQREAGSLDGWVVFTKPWPADLDAWEQFLHDASGNAVSKDRKVGSPRRIQWMAGPKRTRDHDALASISAMTSSQGRMFYIIDEGATSIVHRPPNWKLVARDAFNGVLLWKREIPTWMTHLANFRAGPVQVTRRLVSSDEEVYTTLGFNAPIQRLDAASGKTQLTFAGSEKTEEIVLHGDTLLAVLGEPNLVIDEADTTYGYWQMSVEKRPTVRKVIAAFNAQSGELLWKKSGEGFDYLVPLSLSASGDQVFYLDNEYFYCVDLASGDEIWRAPFATSGLFLRNYAPTVVIAGDVALCLSWDKLRAFSTEDGRLLWEEKGSMGFASPGDLFVTNGLVWTVPLVKSIWRDSKRDADGKVKTGINIPKSNFVAGGDCVVAMDLHTGEIKKTLSSDLYKLGHHHRCYRNKASEQFLFLGHEGIECIDLVGENHQQNSWARGICQYGIMPANGYLYVPPNPCSCENFVQMDGFLALSSHSSLDELRVQPALDKGPAYQRIAGRRSTPQSEPAASIRSSHAWLPPVRPEQQSDWPTYRGNVSRSGSTLQSLPGKLRVQWQTKLEGKPTAPVVVDRRAYVALVDRQMVYCLDAVNGRTLWSHIAAGRVDSPPTISNELCLFGSADGSVSCLDALTGELVWRFRVASIDRRIVEDNRLESVWPVSGSVLVVNDVVYFAAGRSTYLDGGIRVFGLDVQSGELKYETLLNSEPDSEQYVGALPDLLIFDGQHINMRQIQFDLELNVRPKAELQSLVCTMGLLEDSAYHRQHWALGGPLLVDSNVFNGRLYYQPQQGGKLIVYDDQTAYGVTNPYSHLKYSEGEHQAVNDGHLHQKYTRFDSQLFPIGTTTFARLNDADGPVDIKAKGKLAIPFQVKWHTAAPLQPQAMLLADTRLFQAGWLDSLQIEEKTGRAIDPAHPDPRPSVLRILSTEDGRRLAEYPLESEPTFDGLAAASGSLFVTLKDGTVLRLGE